MLRRVWVIAAMVPLAVFCLALLICTLLNVAYDRSPIALAVAEEAGAVVNVETGTEPNLRNQTYRLRLDKNGRGILQASLSESATLKLYFLQVTFRANDPRTRLVIFRRSDSSSDGTSVATIAPDETLQRVYLSSPPTPQGLTNGFIFGVQGPAGTEVELELAPVLPYSPWHHAKDVAAKIASVSPWTITSINNYPDPGRWASALPLVLSLGVLLGLALAVFVIASRLGLPKSTWLRSFALLFVFCWVLLDLNWLQQQRYNARQALKTFSGKTESARLRASPDASIHRLSQRVFDEVRSSDSTPAIFVSSTSDYAGMRAAYFLYPMNVYWERFEELPAQKSFVSGDHILVVNPTRHRYSGGYITYPDRSDRIAAELLFSEPLGALFRVR